jgi:hypothetical protein
VKAFGYCNLVSRRGVGRRCLLSGAPQSTGFSHPGSWRPTLFSVRNPVTLRERHEEALFGVCATALSTGGAAQEIRSTSFVREAEWSNLTSTVYSRTTGTQINMCRFRNGGLSEHRRHPIMRR